MVTGNIGCYTLGMAPPLSCMDTCICMGLVLLQGFTVAAVTRPDDLPQPDELDAAIAALARGLLDT